jgi:Uma2 family endonuclease
MAATTTRLMTVAEFSQLPDDDGPVYLELHNGEVVSVPRPKVEHTVIQTSLYDLVKPIVPPGSFLSIEVPFQSPAGYDLRVADVAWISPERWKTADRKDWFRGAPDLVIEVLSPSNTVSEMYEKERLCLENGTKEFWVVDPDRRQVRISTPDGPSRTWTSGQEIRLRMFGDHKLPVDAIFA